MSEDPTTGVYLVMAAINLVIGIGKGVALLRERTTTLALITLSFAVSVLVYAAASPAGYRGLGEATGRPSAATLLVYMGIVVCYAITHVLTVLWTVTASPGERALVNRRARTWAGAYAGVLVAMAVAFWSADLDGLPADPMRFNTDFVEGRPVVLVFLILFLSALSCATLSTARLARRTVPADPTLQHAVRYFSVSMVICFGYVLCNAPAVLFASFGNHALDDVGVLGSLFGTVAAVLTSYGMTGAAITAWLRERRDIKALQPLWQLAVQDVDERLALTPSGSGLRLANVRFLLHRRVVEILDGMRVLRAWSSTDAVEIIRRHVEASASSLPTAKRQAVVTAAVLRDASRRLQTARSHAARSRQARLIPSEASVSALLGEDTAASDERGRLLLVAAHLDHPLVGSALQELGVQDIAQQGPAAGAR
ncbi:MULTISPECIES: MAB_1171c family putative transporter [unclassified Streptomyces]|uniref:MAB_1171c family putative transporter n=1 Tax=unclassified Streptomyces TaxID=2593676 RepID=UPI0033A30E76